MRRIGKGAYGEVWLARNALGTYRAVKIVHRAHFADERPYEREFRGIEKFEPISRLHESQVDILQVGRNEMEGYFYYVMELADDAGGNPNDESEPPAPARTIPSIHQSINPTSYAPRTLKLELARRGHLPAEECIQIGLSLSTALEHLHSNGLVHRDVKLSNIIFIGGVPKLADIGLVADVDATMSFGAGTEGYIPPEGQGKPQADLYSLGKVLYEACTGKDRQEFPEPPTLWEQEADESALREFHEVLLKACDPDLRKRYQSARDMRADIALVQSGKSLRRLHVLEQRVKSLARSGMVGTALLVVVTAALLLTLYKRKADRESIRAQAAERVAQERLWSSYLVQARGNRLERRAGQRFDSLDLLAKAAAIRPSIELRNEAIATLVLPDLRRGKNLPSYPSGTNYNAFDKDFERYAHGDPSGHVSVRRVQDDGEIARLQGMDPPFEYQVLWISSNGEFVAAKYVYGRSNVLFLWRVAPKEKLLELSGSSKEDLIAHFSPDNCLAAFSGHDGPIVIYNLQRGKERNRIVPAGHPVCLRFSPDAQRLAVGTDDPGPPAIHLYDAQTGAETGLLKPPHHVACMDWHPDSKVLAAGADSGEITLWSLATTKQLAMLEGHTSKAGLVTFNSAGDLLATYAWDQTLRLWDPLLAKQLLQVPCGSLGLHFSSDDRWLGEGCNAQSLYAMEVAQGHECRRLGRHSRAMAGAASFNHDGRWLATSGRDGVRLWDRVTHRQLAFLQMVDCSGFVLSPKEHKLLLWGDAGFQCWPMAFEEEAGQLNLRLGPPQDLGPKGPKYRALSPDRQRIVALVGNGAVVWTGGQAQGEPLRLAHPMAGGAAFSPDGKWLTTATWHGTGPAAKVWDVSTGFHQTDLPLQHTAQALFSPDARWLVTATTLEYKFWEVGSWSPGQSISRREAPEAFGFMAFSPGGDILATCHASAGLQLFEFPSGRLLATLSTDDQYPLAFSHDGAELATGDVQVGSSRVDLQACKLEYSIVSPK